MDTPERYREEESATSDLGTPAERRPWVARHTAWYLALVYGYAVAAGVIGVIAPQAATGGSDAALLLNAVAGIASAVWINVDDRERGRNIPAVLRVAAAVAALLYPMVAVPAYVVLSRGWRGVIWAAVHYAGFLAADFTAGFAAAFLSALWVVVTS